MLYMGRIHIYLYTFGRFVGTICGKKCWKKQTWTIQVKCPVLNLRLLLSAGLRASMYHLSTSDVDNSAIMHCVSMTSHVLRTSLGHMDSPKQSCLYLSNSSATLRFPWSGATADVNLSTNILLGAPSEPSWLHPWPIMEIVRLLNCCGKAPFCFGLSIWSSPNWGENCWIYRWYTLTWDDGLL
jgi:hypothetical protein